MERQEAGAALVALVGIGYVEAANNGRYQAVGVGSFKVERQVFFV